MHVAASILTVLDLTANSTFIIVDVKLLFIDDD